MSMKTLKSCLKKLKRKRKATKQNDFEFNFIRL